MNVYCRLSELSKYNVGSVTVKVFYFWIQFWFNFSSNFTQRKNVQIDEAAMTAMTDTLRGNNNLLKPSSASNPNKPRIKREASTEKVHTNYGIWLSIIWIKTFKWLFCFRLLLSLRCYHPLQSTGNVDNFTRSTC